ncbi:hypothetical protein ANCDUO_04471 [Ancylostoma duodenale]|uniref:Uncharacterized protein n=1 Tax=Ancylostoma duodenale TaxID=51022 RepID=A0A0C2D6G1_9BILA|nr:hypothetical protein ANCDUO_04471 [Ancylostoma duodenale]
MNQNVVHAARDVRQIVDEFGRVALCKIANVGKTVNRHIMQAVQVLQKLFEDYKRTTPGKLKIIDAYMLYILLTGIAQLQVWTESQCRRILFLFASQPCRQRNGQPFFSQIARGADA